MARIIRAIWLLLQNAVIVKLYILEVHEIKKLLNVLPIRDTALRSASMSEKVTSCAVTTAKAHDDVNETCNDVTKTHATKKTLYIRTPMIVSRKLSLLAGCPVYLKLENTQPCGSFKLRGISNMILKVSLNSTAFRTLYYRYH